MQVLCVLYDLTIGKDANTKLRTHMAKSKQQRTLEKKTSALGVSLDPSAYDDLKGMAQAAKEQYSKDESTNDKPWDLLAPKERAVRGQMDV